MQTDLLYVCSLSAVEDTIASCRASHLVTLINNQAMLGTPPAIHPDNHLRLAMNDICEERPGQVAPCADHVAELIDFARAWGRDAPMLIHCWAGISRSTAAAFISLCALNPGADERAIARALREASPTAYPNRLIVRLGDAVLGREGRMVAAVESIGRGEVVEEARAFGMPLRMTG